MQGRPGRTRLVFHRLDSSLYSPSNLYSPLISSPFQLVLTMPPISFLPFLQTVPWGTRILTALLLFSSLAQFLLASIIRQRAAVLPAYGHELPWLVLVPKTSWVFPWTLLTAGFVELNLIEVGSSWQSACCIRSANALSSSLSRLSPYLLLADILNDYGVCANSCDSHASSLSPPM